MESENKKMEETKKKWQKSYFDVLGICCTSEIPLIENILKNLDGIKEYSVIVPSRTVIVVHDSFLISPSQIAKALNEARLEANIKVDGKSSYKNKWPNPFAVVSGVFLLLSVLKFVYSPFRWLAVVAVAAGIYPILAKAFVSIKRFRVDITILIIITVIATLAMQDYMEAAAVVFLFTIADWLETRASYKANSVMQSLMSLAPQKAVIAETGEEVEVDEVEINTILAVKAGETVPIDGIVVTGNCEIDEKTLTGEAFPVPKQKDSIVWAGTMNLNGYISVKTTSLAQDCVVAKMAKLVEEAQTSKTKSQRFIDTCSQYYTPAIIVISACIAIVPAAMKVHNVNYWLHLALVVLVSGCPCGLILSTPVATFCALTKAATSGLLIKSADSLDTLSKIKIIAFDKTGTITRGEFIVVDFISLSKDISLRSLLYWVSSVESKSSHPMATTLVEYAKSVSVEPKSDEVEDYQSFAGEGIYGKIDGNQIYIGNKRLALRAGCLTVPEIEVDVKGGKTIGYVYVGQKLAGVFKVSDACRSGVAQAMKELKSLGIRTAMLTGDNQEAAMYAQEQLENSLDIVNAELLPEDKSKIIEEFKKQGPTAMVGDGVNDAPALATANIGISMGISGSALATQTGDVILMSNDIRRIPQAIKLARRAHRKVIENVFISISLKAAILVLAFAGHPLIWAAVLVDVGTCLLVILNSMLLLREKSKTGGKCYRASTSVLNTKLLEANDDDVDLEAGLLRSQCNSGCCGNKNNQEKVMRLSGGVDKLPRKNRSDHCRSDCCDDKQEVKVVRQSCCGEKTQKPALSSCKKSAHVHHDLKKKRDLKSDSGCCGNKSDKAKEIVTVTCCDKPDGLKKAHNHMKSIGECRSHHKEQVEENVATQSCLDQAKELQTKAGGICKSRCCDDKENVKETLTHLLAATEDTCYLEKSLKSKDEGNCKSGFCEGEKETGEITVVSSVSEKHKLVHHLGCSSSKGEVKQSCHGKHTAEITIVSSPSEKHNLDHHLGCSSIKGAVKQSCHEKHAAEITVMSSSSETHNLDHHSGCSKKGAVKQSCHDKHDVLVKVGLDMGEAEAEDTDLEKGLQIKKEGHSKPNCCSAEKQSSEITLASDEETDCSPSCCNNEDETKQICHEKPVSSKVVDLDSDCKTICCGNTDEACEGVSLKQKRCTDSIDLEGDLLQIKVDKTSESTCCSSDKKETVKSSSQSCCTNPHLVLSNLPVKRDEHKELSCCETSERVAKVESCCEVKVPKACKTKCREREIRHSGKSCCRSYAQECCRHRHHHHHHHHHVGATAGFSHKSADLSFCFPVADLMNLRLCGMVILNGTVHKLRTPFSSRC